MQQTREETKKYSSQKIADNLSLGGYYTEFMKLCSPVTNVDYGKLVSLPLKEKMDGEIGVLGWIIVIVVFIVGLVTLFLSIFSIYVTGKMSYNVNVLTKSKWYVKLPSILGSVLSGPLYYPYYYLRYGDAVKPSKFVIEQLKKNPPLPSMM